MTASQPSGGSSSRYLRPLVGSAAAIALVLRVIWGLWVDHPPQGLYDPARYVGYAKVIAAGKGMIEPLSGHPTAYYPPGYPWFLGIIAWLGKPFTHNVVTLAVLVQAVLGAATVVLGARVGHRLAGPRSAVIAAFGLALYPNLIFHSGSILGETLYDFLFMAFAVVFLGSSWPSDLTRRRLVASGLLLGLAVMVRPISLAVLPVIVLAIWAAEHRLTTAVLKAGLVTAAVVACIAPWTVRNAVRMHERIPISTNTGDNLCIGHGPLANGSFGARPDCVTHFNFLDGPASEVGADRAKTKIAIDAIKADPGREPWLTWRRFWFMWVRDGDHDGVLAVQSYNSDPFLGPVTTARLNRVADVVYWIVAPVGALGLLGLAWRRRPEDLAWVGFTVMTALVPLAFFGDSRFKVPVIPLLIVAASWWADGARRSSPGR